jgi:serine/threonine protein kinase
VPWAKMRPPPDSDAALGPLRGLSGARAYLCTRDGVPLFFGPAVSRLGEGGNSVVMRGEHGGTPYAIKVARRPEPARRARSELYREPCRDAVMWSILRVATARIPGGCWPYVGRDPDTGAEFVGTVSTVHHRADLRALPPRMARAFFGALARFLGRAQGIGVIHGDFHSGNVLLRAEGAWDDPVVIDYGLSRCEGEGFDGELLCAPMARAPELWERKKATGAADIWGLGVLIATWITGLVAPVIPLKKDGGRYKRCPSRQMERGDPARFRQELANRIAGGPAWAREAVLAATALDPLERAGPEELAQIIRAHPK